MAHWSSKVSGANIVQFEGVDFLAEPSFTRSRAFAPDENALQLKSRVQGCHDIKGGALETLTGNQVKQLKPGARVVVRGPTGSCKTLFATSFLAQVVAPKSIRGLEKKAAFLDCDASLDFDSLRKDVELRIQSAGVQQTVDAHVAYQESLSRLDYLVVNGPFDLLATLGLLERQIRVGACQIQFLFIDSLPVQASALHHLSHALGPVAVARAPRMQPQDVNNRIRQTMDVLVGKHRLISVVTRRQAAGGTATQEKTAPLVRKSLPEVRLETLDGEDDDASSRSNIVLLTDRARLVEMDFEAAEAFISEHNTIAATISPAVGTAFTYAGLAQEESEPPSYFECNASLGGQKFVSSNFAVIAGQLVPL
eukprot:GHVU01204375.1.p1 GENE.GHVU01204375.1~~GHVU01204375.1.p1  ORF type:complete len:366 (-),score=45.22 GHVU01204375.1:867-1964(-)